MASEQNHSQIQTQSQNQSQDPETSTDLEQTFKPSNRPQSTIALSFASTLDSAFSLSPSLDNLSQSISAKQSALTSQERELEALEARIRETEERLKRSRASSPNPNPTPTPTPNLATSGGGGGPTSPRSPRNFPLNRTTEAGLVSAGKSPLVSPPPRDERRQPHAQAYPERSSSFGVGVGVGADSVNTSTSTNSRPPTSSSRKTWSRGRTDAPVSRGSER